MPEKPRHVSSLLITNSTSKLTLVNNKNLKLNLVGVAS